MILLVSLRSLSPALHTGCSKEVMSGLGKLFEMSKKAVPGFDEVLSPHTEGRRMSSGAVPTE